MSTIFAPEDMKIFALCILIFSLFDARTRIALPTPRHPRKKEKEKKRKKKQESPSFHAIGMLPAI
jgi:hypothetical protein